MSLHTSGKMKTKEMNPAVDSIRNLNQDSLSTPKANNPGMSLIMTNCLRKPCAFLPRSRKMALLGYIFGRASASMRILI